jgi:hypothetical protein
MMVVEVGSCVDIASGSSSHSRSSACEQFPRGHVVRFLVVKGSAGLASLRAAAVVQREMYYDRQHDIFSNHARFFV